MIRSLLLFALVLLPVGALAAVPVDELYDLVEHRYADNDRVRIHYVTIGAGPLVVFVHGFPDQWYAWRHQMAALADDYQVVAISLRGYNRSDKPNGVEHYAIEHLTSDVAVVIADTGRESAVIVGHDWGGIVSWFFGEQYPDMIDALVIFNRPHPGPLRREMALSNEQKRRSGYIARFTTTTGDLGGMDAERLASRRAEPGTPWYDRYLEAFRRSDYESMINYYRAYYPQPPWLVDEGPKTQFPVPVLQFHGLDDGAYVNTALNQTWEWMAGDLTLVTLPGVGHNSQNTGDIEFVTGMLQAWLQLKLR